MKRKSGRICCLNEKKSLFLHSLINIDNHGEIILYTGGVIMHVYFTGGGAEREVLREIGMFPGAGNLGRESGYGVTADSLEKAIGVATIRDDRFYPFRDEYLHGTGVGGR